jgi:hypothetical protein
VLDSRQRQVGGTTAPRLPESQRVRCRWPILGPPSRRCLDLYCSERRYFNVEYFRSGDPAKTFKKFLSGDCFSPLGLSDRFQELRLEFRWNLKGLVRFASKDGDDRTFWQGIPFHDDLSVYNGASGYLHSENDTRERPHTHHDAEQVRSAARRCNGWLGGIQ